MKEKKRLSVCACWHLKKVPVLPLNCYSQAILMSGCFFKERSSLYLNRASGGICEPQLTVSFDGEARNCLNPDGLKYSPRGRSSPWLLFFSQHSSPSVENYCRGIDEVFSGVWCTVSLHQVCLSSSSAIDQSAYLFSVFILIVTVSQHSALTASCQSLFIYFITPTTRTAKSKSKSKVFSISSCCSITR